MSVRVRRLRLAYRDHSPSTTAPSLSGMYAQTDDRTTNWWGGHEALRPLKTMRRIHRRESSRGRGLVAYRRAMDVHGYSVLYVTPPNPRPIPNMVDKDSLSAVIG